jgi:hypothetical protein
MGVEHPTEILEENIEDTISKIAKSQHQTKSCGRKKIKTGHMLEIRMESCPE